MSSTGILHILILEVTSDCLHNRLSSRIMKKLDMMDIMSPQWARKTRRVNLSNCASSTFICLGGILSFISYRSKTSVNTMAQIATRTRRTGYRAILSSASLWSLPSRHLLFLCRSHIIKLFLENLQEQLLRWHVCARIIPIFLTYLKGFI
jgi:hypothetical protein